MSDLLLAIQQLQFTDRGGAEALLRSFLSETFGLDVARVALRPQAVSLNSFNGFLTLSDGRDLFFKTHVEQDTVIDEYYNAAMLAEAGYPVIQPVFSSTRNGQQILMYEIVREPSVFDLAREIETTGADFTALAAAQHAADDLLLALYLKTLQTGISQTAPIHQLFYHRLAGGRLDRFYGDGTEIALPGGVVPLRTVRRARWRINDADYTDTLEDIITRALRLLAPGQVGPTVTGHGDAHNGNVFFAQQLVYFDPAFAGRHHPLLDLAKPLFHNVFAMWMYFPDDERARLRISLERDGDLWHVQHDYAPNPLRLMFLTSKAERVLRPLLLQLAQAGLLREDWRAFLKAALFCCPLLTLDLKRFPPEISLLGLAMAVTMGAESSSTSSLIDRVLDAASP